MYRVIVIATAIFTSFIVWMIYLANTGQNSVFFNIATLVPYGDKLSHFFLFGLLALGVNLVLKLRSFRLARITVPIGSAVTLSAVMLEEFSQYYVTTRTLDYVDMLASIGGIAIFSVFLSSPFIRGLVVQSILLDQRP